MHYLAGALMILEFALLCLVDRTVSLRGLNYIAWAIWTVAMVLLFLPMFTLRSKGGVAKGKSYIDTEVLVDTGLYAVVRHPQYLGWMLMYLVGFLFNPRWPLAVVGILGAVCVYVFTREEETLLVEKFGEAYEHYMQSVPRMNLLVGAMRLLRWRKRG